MSEQLVGPNFNLTLMQKAQEQGLAALAEIAKQIVVGMTETQANALALAVLSDFGAETNWHPPIIRFGANSCKIYSEPSDLAVHLQKNDIFFIDLGPVFQGHEADIGATFVVGDAPEHQACAAAVAAIFQQVAMHWQKTGCHGEALYAFAEQQATALGYQFNQEIKGHRLGDFPHRLYANGRLGDLTGPVRDGIWVLEIQIRHPSLPIGGFMEQVLFTTPAVAH